MTIKDIKKELDRIVHEADESQPTKTFYAIFELSIKLANLPEDGSK